MSVHTKSTSQEAEKKGFLNRLKRLSRRNKVIGIAVLVFLILLIVSIPGDRNELINRQDRVEAAQVAYGVPLPGVALVMERVIAFLDDTEIDLSDNRSYTGLARNLESFNRESSTLDSRFRAMVTFHGNVHSLLDGEIEGLNTDEFRELVIEMDGVMGDALLALLEMNVAIDEYNGYHNWISAKITGALFGLPDGYDDPIPSRSRLSSTSLDQ